MKKLLVAGAVTSALLLFSNNAFSKQEHVLNYNVMSEPASLDPHLQNGTWERRITENVMETLVGYDEHGNLSPNLQNLGLQKTIIKFGFLP